MSDVARLHPLPGRLGLPRLPRLVGELMVADYALCFLAVVLVLCLPVDPWDRYGL